MVRNSTTYAPNLETYDALSDALGDNFVIFCGSAISAFPDTEGRNFLPAVDEVKKIVFGGLARRVRYGNYHEQLVAKYADELMRDRGKYPAIRWQTKFEELLWDMERLFSQEIVASFLEALFFCEDTLHNFNHRAVMTLLKQNRATACLTTNFDNGIENASGSSLFRYIHPNRPGPEQFQQGGCLLKLHGDVIERTYVATTPALFDNTELKAFEYIQFLLKGRTVLVVGYSGLGDIDIAPHLRALRATGTRLIWMVPPKSAPPSLATDWFFSDLRGQSQQSNNWLMGLAGLDESRTTYVRPDWETRTNRWINELNLETFKDILPLVFRGRVSWSLLHLNHVRHWQSEADKKPRDQNMASLTLGFERASSGIYYSAFRSLNGVHSDDRLAMSRRYFWEGFVNWRLGYFRTAMQRFEEALNGLEEHTTRIDPPRSKAEILRLYLEAATEKIGMFASVYKRKRLFESLGLEDKIKLLELQDQEDPSQKSLSDIGIRNIKFLLEEDVHAREQLLEEMKTISEQAYNLQDWLAAAAAARILIKYNFSGVADVIKPINERLAEESGRNLIRQNKMAVLGSRIPFARPYLISILGRWLLANLKASWLELVYQFKVLSWRRDFRRPRRGIEE